jgi:hypothetical protein
LRDGIKVSRASTAIDDLRKHKAPKYTRRSGHCTHRSIETGIVKRAIEAFGVGLQVFH